MAIPPVVIQFIADGVPDVSRAVRTIGDIVTRSERQSVASVRGGSSARIREATREATERVRAASRAESMISAAQRAGNREVESRARADVRAATQAANEKLRVAQRLAAEESRLRAQVVRTNLQRAGFRNASASNPNVVNALVPTRGGVSSPDVDALRTIRAQQKIDTAHDASSAREEKEAARASAAKEKIAKREADEKIRAMKVADREMQKAQQDGVRFAEKAERDRVRAAENAEREKNRDAARWLRRRENEERDSTRRRQQFARTMVGGASSSLRAAGGLLASGGRMMTQLGGGFAVADAVQERMRAQGLAADIANSGFQPGGDKAENKMKRSSSSLLDAATQAGTPYAFSQTETLQGLSKFTSKTGDLDVGVKLLPQLAQMARATGASFDDLADAAGDVFNSDTKQTSEQVLQTMRVISAQGKLGAVEIKDLASQMAKLGAAAGQFGDGKDTAENLAQFGAIAQVTRAKGGAASATQAATSVASFANTFSKGARLDAFESMGVKVRDQKGNLFAPQKIITESLQAAESHGGMAKFDRNMGSMFMDVRARSAVKGFEKTYREAGGGSKGVEAVNAEFNRMKAAQSEAEIQSAAAARMAEADMQFTKAVLDLKEATSRELIPAFTRMVPDLVRLTPLLGQLAREGGKLLQQFMDLASANPLGGLGIVLGAAVAKEVASAGLAAVFEKALASKLGASGGLVVASAVMAITLATMAVDKMADDEQKKQNFDFKTRADAANAIGELRTARESGNPEEIKKAQAKALAAKDYLTKNIETTKSEAGGSDLFYGAALTGAFVKDAVYTQPKQLVNGQELHPDAVNSVIASRMERENNDTTLVANMQKDLAELTKALNENTRVTRQNSNAAGAAGSPTGTSAPSGPINTRVKLGP